MHGLPRGVLQVVKMIAGTDRTVEGVVIRVEKLTDGQWVPVGDITTNASGTATMTKLRTGRYRLYEIQAPDDLALRYPADAPYEFELNVDTPDMQSLSLTVENAIRTASVTATKAWKNPDGSENAQPHPTVCFQL